MWAALFYLRKGRNDLLRPYHEGRNHHGQRKDHRLLLQDVSAGTGLNRAGDGGGGYYPDEIAAVQTSLDENRALFGKILGGLAKIQ